MNAIDSDVNHGVDSATARYNRTYGEFSFFRCFLLASLFLASEVIISISLDMLIRLVSQGHIIESSVSESGTNT